MPAKKQQVYHRLGDAPDLIKKIRKSGEVMGSIARHIHQSHHVEGESL